MEDKEQKQPNEQEPQATPPQQVASDSKADSKADPNADSKAKGDKPQAQKVTEAPRSQLSSRPRGRGRGPQRGGRDRQSPAGQEEDAPEFVEKVLSIKRVTKVTKGGKKLSFSALVVVGDTKGNVGYGLDKAGEVATAIKKSLNMAKKNMVKVHLKGTTIPHQITGINGGAHVLLKPASDGTGVIAAGPVRAVCDGAGIHNILTKCLRSNNPINVVKATMNGLMRLKPYREEATEE